MLRAAFIQKRLLFRNLGNGRFQDVSASSGDAIVAQRSSRGLASGDIDNDGDTDVVITNMNDRPSLLRNDGGNRNSFITIRLIGTKSNRSAIGAKVTATVGKRILVDQVRSGSTFLSQSDFRVTSDLGAPSPSIALRFNGQVASQNLIPMSRRILL